jgi:hypothetical protein
MAYALIDSVLAVTSDNQNVTTGAIDTSGANFLVLAVSGIATVTFTVTDSKGNTWVPRTAYVAGAIVQVQVFYATNTPTVGSGHTFTVTKDSGPSFFPAGAVAAFSGAHATAPFDQENGSSGNGVSFVSTGNVTPTQDNELIIAAASFSGTLPVVTGGSLAVLDEVAAAASMGISLAYEIQTSATTIAATFTPGGSRDIAAAIETFKVAASAATTPNPHLTELVRPFNMTVSRGRM